MSERASAGMFSSAATVTRKSRNVCRARQSSEARRCLITGVPGAPTPIGITTCTRGRERGIVGRAARTSARGESPGKSTASTLEVRFTSLGSNRRSGVSVWPASAASTAAIASSRSAPGSGFSTSVTSSSGADLGEVRAERVLPVALEAQQQRDAARVELDPRERDVRLGEDRVELGPAAETRVQRVDAAAARPLRRGGRRSRTRPRAASVRRRPSGSAACRGRRGRACGAGRRSRRAAAGAARSRSRPPTASSRRT